MEVKKTVWKNSEDGNKCLAKPTIEVTAEMEERGVEVSRTRVDNFDYVTYYDAITEVYWAEKSDLK